MCFEAVKSNGSSLQFVPKNLKTVQVCLEMEDHNIDFGEWEESDDIAESLKSDFDEYL